MSSPEELTFVVGRWLQPIVVLLHVVRRLGLMPTSSREQREYGAPSLIRARLRSIRRSKFKRDAALVAF